MKVIYGKCLVSVIVIMLLATCFFALKVHAAEPSLVEILNTLGFTNIAESPVETFVSGTYNVTLYAEFAGYYDSNELSFYQVGSTVYELIFSGSEGGSGYIATPISKNISSPGEFGLSMYSPEGYRYFTENSFNPDGDVHSKVYLNLDDSEMYLIGFENMFNSSADKDFQDMVFSLEVVQPPEPTQYYLSVISQFGVVGGEGFYDTATNAYASLDTGVIDYGNGTQSVFTGWSGDASGTNYLQSDPILMDQNKTAVADWITETIVTAADFAYSPPFPEMFEDVTFDASSSNGTIAEFLWDFGDGNVTSTGDPVVAHQFADFGTFNVSLTVTDVGGGNDTMWQLIKISGRPNAAFTYTPLEPHALEEVTFNASGSEANGGSIVSYAWDFGDGAGNTTGALTVKHTYAAAGDFNVTLMVTDDRACREQVGR